MSNNNLNENLHHSLNELCSNLFSMLNETENLLNIEKEKYNQVKSVYTPWPVKIRKTIENIPLECTCTCTKSEILTENTLTDTDSSIVNGIPKIVNKTKALRTNPSKINVTRFADAKKSIKEVISLKSKPDNIITTKSSKSTVKTTNIRSASSLLTATIKSTSVDTIKTHSPSCMLYGSEISKDTSKSLTYSNLSQTVSTHGVPSTLQKTLNDYHKFILESDNFDSITKKARHTFLKNLHRQNEESWLEVTKTMEKLPKYMSAVCTIQEKLRKQYELPCIIYKNVNELVMYEKFKFEGFEKDMWLKILETINKKCLPTLLNSDLSEKDKVYICKMIKILCNFSRCKVPNVPVYKMS